MKEKHESLGHRGMKPADGPTAPAIIERVSAVVPASKKTKSVLPKSAIKEMKALEKSVNESKPRFAQNSPDYSPAQQKKQGIKIPKQKKRTFY